MIRFCGRKLIESADMNITIISESIMACDNLWDAAKKIFKRHISNDAVDILMIPVVDARQEVVCYAYQDNEANREMRMLKELEKNNEILQLKDVFPDVREVVVCGCNELAYCFIKYLEKQKISVTVVGKYWKYFEYYEADNIDVDGKYTLVVYAEDIIPKAGSLYQTVVRSVSPEFECIDRIYEANVLEGKIKNAKGSIEELLKGLRGKEVLILGTDVDAQDAYDFLYENGIDICCFSEWQEEKKSNVCRTLLGKNVVGLAESINSKTDAVFISNSDKDSAYGTTNVEIFDYYGYERNEQFFLLHDYVDVPCTNLLHILKGKKVYLIGDKPLCIMLSDYLINNENGDIELVYVEISQCVEMEKTDILCVVNPWFDLKTELERNPRVWYFEKMLSERGIVSYTDYFSQVQSLVYIDLYRNKGKEKYSLKKLCPKGILLGRIPAAGGNIFFRGILDGHPDIMKWKYCLLNNNLFLYCIRLAGEKAENILSAFGKMYFEEFAFRLGEELGDWDKFQKSMKSLLSLKESFTSQELFILFHISFAEMLYGYKILDLNQKIIYWEPHHFSRKDFPFLAQWLEDDGIHGQTVFMHRDNIVWTGSYYKFYKGKPSVFDFVPDAQGYEGLEYEGSEYEGTADIIKYKHWEEFHIRLEDIKLHPQRELRKICGRLGLQWSDTLLQVTDNGQILTYSGDIRDFDIKPVFNKYEEFLSEFDRFRISLISSLYQKKYGYTHEDCMKFSRRELQELFLKEFRFQEELKFASEKDKNLYFYYFNKLFLIQLWKVRKHTIMNDIIPEFEEIEIGETITKKLQRVKVADKKELSSILKFVREHEQLVIYGIGKDCEGLLKHLGEEEMSRLVFSDMKAEYTEKIFHGRKVVAPSELCGKYKDYKVLITSSQFYENMQQRLEDMGITKDRITCNRFQLWE